MENDNTPPIANVVNAIDVNGDATAMFNLREWMRKILEANNCKMTGSGMGFGGADLWFEHQGAEYFLTIKPCMR